MNDNNLRLDNAAGGLLNEVFQFEMTYAETTYGGCGTKKSYRRTDALRARAGRNSAQRRLRHGVAADHIGGCYRLDLSGITYLRIAADIH
jgi:hypothetical protein